MRAGNMVIARRSTSSAASSSGTASCSSAEGFVQDPRSVAVQSRHRDDITLSAEFIVIATGTIRRSRPSIKLDDERS